MASSASRTRSVSPCIRCEAPGATAYWGEYVEKLVAPAEEDVGDDEEVQIQEVIEPMCTAPDPGQPTYRQVTEHRRTHIPYRVWCNWCVLGRGRGLQHRRSAGPRVATVDFDYFFITAGGIKKREELSYEMTPEDDKEMEDARVTCEAVK